MQQQSKQALLTEGSIIKTLLSLSGPMLIGILSMMAFNLIDTYFIGQLGTVYLAAITLTFPVIMIITTFTIGIGVGALATISRALGQGDQEQVKRLTTDSLSLSLMLVCLLIGIGMVTIDQTFILLGASEETLPLVKEYMHIWYPGMIFVVIPMVGNNAIRATGDTKIPSLIMLFGMVLNAILDPIFIFGFGPIPRLELAGAAIATVIARALTLIFSLYILYKREKMLTWPFPKLAILFDSWKKIVKIGIPVAFSNTTIPISMGVVTRIISTLGSSAVAAFGIVTRVEGFGFVLIFALSTGLSPFIGQNMGAEKADRAWKGTVYICLFSVIWGLILFLTLLLSGKSLASLFNQNSTVVSIAALYFMIVPISYGLKGIHQIVWTSLNVLNRPIQAFGLEIIHAMILYVPLALLGAKLFGLIGIFSAALLANILGGIIAWTWIKKVFNNEMKG